MKAKTTEGAGLADRAQHAGDAGPAQLGMANELLDAKIERLETHHPLALRRSRR